MVELTLDTTCQMKLSSHGKNDPHIVFFFSYKYLNGYLDFPIRVMWSYPSCTIYYQKVSYKIYATCDIVNCFLSGLDIIFVINYNALWVLLGRLCIPWVS